MTKDELDRMNRTSIQLADGSGDYLAAVDVFHHLHCLVIRSVTLGIQCSRLRRKRSVISSTPSTTARRSLWSILLTTSVSKFRVGLLRIKCLHHQDHCLDAIRQELMCRAEVTFTTYDWLPDISIPWAQLSYQHECVNFEASGTV